MKVISHGITDGIIDDKYGKHGEHFNENGLAYDKIYLNSNLVNKMKPFSNVVLFVDITPQSYNRNDDKSHYYYNIRVVNVGK